MSHTPGPWVVVRPPLGAGPQAPLWVNACDVRIANVFEEDASKKSANAAIISAAPEMLAALKNLESLVSGWLHDANSPSHGIPALVAARAAIAKAEGKTP